jgi:hydroxyacylglutathione hydrolase
VFAPPTCFRFARERLPRDNGIVRIHTIPAGPIETNAYLLSDAKRGEALLVDAPHGVWDEIEPLLQQSGCRLVALLITHGHWDHIGDAARIQALGVSLYAHEADRRLIETPQIMAPFMISGIGVEPAQIDVVVRDGQHIEIMGERIEVRHVPGHCPGNVLYYFASLGAAFVGDALFNGGIGRTDLPLGSFEHLARSIRTRIYTLPANTVVYPGHGPETTVGDEMSGNPFVTA